RVDSFGPWRSTLPGRRRSGFALSRERSNRSRSSDSRMPSCRSRFLPCRRRCVPSPRMRNRPNCCSNWKSLKADPTCRSPMKRSSSLLLNAVLLFAVAAMSLSSVRAEDVGDRWGTEEREREYYPIVNLPTPKDLVLEAGAFCVLPDGRIAVGTRYGEIYLIT